MKKVFSLLGALVLIFIMSASVLAAPKVVLDGQPLSFDVPPTIEDGRTLVPLRTIFEALGANVSWDAKTQTVTATKGNYRGTINSLFMALILVNNLRIMME